MEPHSKRRRKHSQHEDQNPVPMDRISDLTESVICHILSFLRTKDSVRTSILARRWRYLWAYVLTLDLYCEEETVINRVLLLRKVQTLHTLRLNVDGCTEYGLETWIVFAITHGLQKLDLYLMDQEILPACLFTCKTLVDLRLHSCGPIPMDGPMFLPRLKKLQLIRVEYEADESLPYLISCCPVLEELLVQLFTDMASCNVSSPTVKRLTVDFYFFDGDRAGCDMLEINTPALEYLKIAYSFCDHIKCGVATSLIEADISFHDEDDNLSARSLSCDEKKGSTEPPEQVPKCLLSHLRIIKVVKIEGKKHEFEIIRYLLRNTQVLEKMDIEYAQCLASEEDISTLKKTISPFQRERGSAACEVAFAPFREEEVVEVEDE
ncbi:hypothetical protein MIMGU_mgv1a026551mg [Erythranthe guttata]|uniref:FBD domain-containing protein n=1 Tax=Erythranthe guttata TaxID=4155 RepID=A0A022RXX9_ERYGU|nr:hypothetical protein MIMGU_mgv1a026551mg [Erythranthe guttata]